MTAWDFARWGITIFVIAVVLLYSYALSQMRTHLKWPFVVGLVMIGVGLLCLLIALWKYNY